MSASKLDFPPLFYSLMLMTWLMFLCPPCYQKWQSFEMGTELWVGYHSLSSMSKCFVAGAPRRAVSLRGSPPVSSQGLNAHMVHQVSFHFREYL